jgi:hypothetical protein
MAQRRRFFAVAVVGLAVLMTSHVVEAQKAISVKSPNGEQVASISKTVIDVRDTKTKKLLWQAKLTDLEVVIVLSGGGGGSKCHPRGPNTAVVRRGTTSIQALAYTPDGKSLAAADRVGVVLIEAATGNFVWSWNLLAGAKELRFTNEGKNLNAKAYNGATMVFDVATGKRVK